MRSRKCVGERMMGEARSWRLVEGATRGHLELPKGGPSRTAGQADLIFAVAWELLSNTERGKEASCKSKPWAQGLP